MKAVVLREFGGPENLRIEDVAQPVPGPGEVLVKVHAVTVNRSLDIFVRQDLGGYGVTLPMVLGVDPAGVVEALGDGVEDRRVGDHVTMFLPMTQGGGYAQYVTYAAAKTTIVPDSVSFPDAAFVGRHFPMAISLVRAVDLKVGEWALVMGAAGALGYSIVQVAKRLGARVVAAAGTDERVAAAVAVGADEGVNYRSQDLAQEVSRITDGGANALFENIGDPTLWPGAFASLAIGGRLVTVGAHGGGTVPLDVRALYNNRITILGGIGHVRPNDMPDALKATAAGEFRTLIHGVMPLSEVQEAHRLVEGGQILGKIILDPTAG